MELGSLLTESTQLKLATIIEDSFDTRPMPSGVITRAEVDHRVSIAKDVYQVLLNESRWSEQRILDHMPVFLTRALDGEEPLPDWAKVREGDNGSAMWGSEVAGQVEQDRRLSALATTGDEPLIIVPGRKFQ